MAGNVAIEAAPARPGWLTRFRPKGKTEFVGYLFILPYLIAFVLFMLIRGINKLKKPDPAAPAPTAPRQEVLLTEIRDLLAKK